jgi:nitrate reductase delta subunit
MMGDASIVAGGFIYPDSESLEALDGALSEMSSSTARREMQRFVKEVGKVDLHRWEELHTETLDLSPKFVPYVGHVVWGENYRRGAFMADLQREYALAGVDRLGELPDHIEPVLRYLDATDHPLPDLVDVLPGAVATMIKDLKKEDRKNPYLHLLGAARAVLGERVQQAAAARRANT